MVAFREITTGLRFPEGPIAMPDGVVVLVEIEGRRLTRVHPDGRKEVICETGGGPNGAAIGPDGRCYICNNREFAYTEDEYGLRSIGQAEDYGGGRIEAVDLATGELEVLYTHSGDIPLKGPNDIVFDRHGGMWFTDLGKVNGRLMDRGAIFYAKADGSFIKEVAFPMITPNGIGLSPDEKRLYVAETRTGRVWYFDSARRARLSIRRPSPRPMAATCWPACQAFGNSTLAVDSAGNVCVATLFTPGITVISPDGQNIDYIDLPDLYVTNICFGGRDLKNRLCYLECQRSPHRLRLARGRGNRSIT